MRTAVFVVLGVALIASAVSAAETKTAPTKMQGEMLCMWCDCVVPALPEKKAEPRKCTAVFRATNGKVYTLVPDKVGKELGDIKMHEQKVELQTCVLPKSQMIEVYSYKVTEKVEPTTPEKGNPWFNF